MSYCTVFPVISVETVLSKKSQPHKPKTYQKYLVVLIPVLHSYVVFIPHPNNVTMRPPSYEDPTLIQVALNH